MAKLYIIRCEAPRPAFQTDLRREGAGRKMAVAKEIAMPAPNDALTLQLLEWIRPGDRGYAETLEAWRSTCPRLSIWEDACADGLIAYEPASRTVSLTDKGRARLEAVS